MDSNHFTSEQLQELGTLAVEMLDGEHDNDTIASHLTIAAENHLAGTPFIVERNGDILKVEPTGDPINPWGWELRVKPGVFGSVKTRAGALGTGMQEWIETYPEDFR
jgi:hypothetical protein